MGSHPGLAHQGLALLELGYCPARAPVPQALVWPLAGVQVDLEKALTAVVQPTAQVFAKL